MGRANIAATFMEHLCNCEAHGYSQSERWGNANRGACYVECEGHTSEFLKGDRDCSSAVIDSWNEALRGTAYEGALANASYTGNMRSVFVNSGLFEWHGMDFSAQRGDIYLNDRDHTAMCTSQVPDLLGEFSLSETGGTEGSPGDQTGQESRIRGYYDYPWNGILHYNGKADGGGGGGGLPPIRYRVFTHEFGWHSWMENLTDTSGSGDDYAGAPGAWVYDFQAENLGNNGWFEIERMDGSITRNSSGNTGSPIVFLTIYYDTDLSKTGGAYKQAKYQVHWLGASPDWSKWEIDDTDGGAGKDHSSPIDMVKLTN